MKHADVQPGAQISVQQHASAVCILSKTNQATSQQVLSYLVDGEVRTVPVPKEWGPVRVGASPELDAALVSSLCLKQRISALSRDVAIAFAN